MLMTAVEAASSLPVKLMLEKGKLLKPEAFPVTGPA
jgi:hypothetical protein